MSKVIDDWVDVDDWQDVPAKPRATPPAKGYEGAGSRTGLLGSLYDAATTALSSGGPDVPADTRDIRERPAREVLRDQAAAMTRMPVKALESAPTAAQAFKMTAKEGAAAFKDMMTGKGSKRAVDMTVPALKAAVEPAVTLVKQTASVGHQALPEVIQRNTMDPAGLLQDVPTPEDPRTTDMAEAAMGNLYAAGATGAAQLAKLPAKQVLNSLARPFKTRSPELNAWMQVEPKEMFHGANPAERVLSEKLLGSTKETTRANVQKALDEAGKAMEEKLNAAGNTGVRINADTHVMGAIVDATKTIGKRSDAAFKARLDGILDDILNDYPNLGNLTPQEAHSLKVDLGKASKWSGVAETEDLNKVLKDIYSRVNGEIKTKIPDIVADMERWGDLKTASGALKKGMVNDLAGRGTGPKPPTPLRKAAKTVAKYAALPLGGALAWDLYQDFKR